MTHSEQSPKRSTKQEHKPQVLELRLTPTPEETVVFDREADGRIRLTFTGKTDILFPAEFALASFLQPRIGGTEPLPDSSEELRNEPQALQAEQTSASDEQTAPDALKSPVTSENRPTSGLVLDSASPALNEQHSTSDSASKTPSGTPTHETPEQGNELHQFTGNPTYNAKYWTYKATATKPEKRVAEFVLATHPDEGQTSYQRIRAFDGLAVYVRDNVRKGQKDVFVEAWGPKQWKTRNEKQLTGFYAKKVKVPKKYRPQQSD